MDNLKNKRVLITGASQGLGAEVARQLHAQGARLSLVGLDKDKLRQLSEELGPDHHWQLCDVRDEQSVLAALESAIESLGGIDALVLNAGISSIGTVRICPPSAMNETIDVNIKGASNFVHHALAELQKNSGYILFVSSSITMITTPGTAAYAASKAALVHFAEALRLEVSCYDIKVGIAYFGFFESNMVHGPSRQYGFFAPMVDALPWPFYIVSKTEKCAAKIVEMISKRQRTGFVPGGLWLAKMAGFIYCGYLWQKLFEFFGKERIEIAEQEVLAGGRFTTQPSPSTETSANPK